MLSFEIQIDYHFFVLHLSLLWLFALPLLVPLHMEQPNKEMLNYEGLKLCDSEFFVRSSAV